MPENDSILDFLSGSAQQPDQSQTLTGGSVGPTSLAKDDMQKLIGSILNAISSHGPHGQEARDAIANQQMPREPSFLEMFEYFPGMRGGVRGPRAISTDLSGRQLRTINQVEDWLNRAGIEYSLNMNRSNATSVYIYARHPTTGENVAIRVPRDGHIGYVDQRAQAKYKDTNRPGNFFDTGHTITNTARPVQPEFVGNVGGEPYHNIDALFDALKHRFSRSPDGQFLVSPGREPHYPSERLTPIPMTEPPIQWGTRGIRREPPPSAIMNTLGRPNTQNGRIVLPPRRPRQLELPLTPPAR